MTNRRSARVAAKSGSSPNDSSKSSAQHTGSKRKAEQETPTTSKRGKLRVEKSQRKIEDSLPSRDDEDSAAMEEPSPASNKQVEVRGPDKLGKGESHSPEKGLDRHSDGDNGHKVGHHKPTVNGFDEIMKQDADEPAQNPPQGTGSQIKGEDSAVVLGKERAEAVPSSILEKGIIYFFFRGRVGVENPGSIKDVARSYIVLRPLPQGAALKEGPIGDTDSMRLLALPKKVLPVSPKDRFLTFVEKANTSIDKIKDQLSSSDYSTKTVGVRHTPSADPIGEGVYAITQTGRETHLAYVLTIPAEIENVQKDVGLRQQGSYITSAKNPKSSAPANASLPQGAEYPQDILDEFGGRGWMPLQPKLLDYENTQFLLIGHGSNALEKAARAENEGEQDEVKETPLEEIERLEGEDEHRVSGLGVEDAIFTDLGLSSKEYSKIRTAW